jgi:type I restriction enzyme S subunit
MQSGGTLAHGFEWDEVVFNSRRADSFVRLRYGKALGEPFRRPGNVPVYGTNGPCGTHDTSLANGPGVILGRKGQGHLGVKWETRPFWVIDTAYFAELDQSEAELRWFYYLVNYVGLDDLKTGEKPGLNRDTFGRQIFPFPPLPEQRAIARVLGGLDDKIEVHREQNRVLEAMAAALFRSWFVDFDPVVAKAAAPGQTSAAPSASRNPPSTPSPPPSPTPPSAPCQRGGRSRSWVP